jgi:DNA replication initiation complex subunit (GINS family)
MTQLTFDSFLQEAADPDVKKVTGKQYIMVLILKDFSVAWTDRNWYLHEQDLVYLDPGLASLLAERGIARRAGHQEMATRNFLEVSG